MTKRSKNQPVGCDNTAQAKVHLTTLVASAQHLCMVNVVNGKDWFVGSELYKTLDKKTRKEVNAI